MIVEGTIEGLVEDRGFGFISAPGLSKNIFFHFSCLHGVRFEDLQKDSRVHVEYEDGPRGLAATSVRIKDGADKDINDEPKDGDDRFYNPYNFVRFLEPLEPESGPSKVSGDQLQSQSNPFGALAAIRDKVRPSESKQDTSIAKTLLGRCAPPPHDRYVGLTGRIICRLKAVTPLFVSDSEDIKIDGKHKSYRFFQIDQKPAIPASSLRGMVRSVFEAATSSCMIHLDAAKGLTRHATDNEAREMVPARVVKDPDSESGLALELLPGNTPYLPGQEPGRGQYAYAAWVPCYLSETLRSSKNTPGPTDYGRRNNLNLDLGRFLENKCWAVLRPYEHPRQHFKFYSVIALALDENDEGLKSREPGDILGCGYLHITNQNIENKHDERFFFRSEQLGEAGPKDRVELSRANVACYEALITEYQERHQSELSQRQRPGDGIPPRDPNVPDRFDSNPQKHKPALSWHIIDKEMKQLHLGTLVYAVIDNHRKVEFMAPVARPRVFYRDRIGQRLPYVFKDALRSSLPGNLDPCRDSEHLCPTCRTFGWVMPGSDLPKQADQQPACADHLLMTANPSERTNKLPAFAGRLRFTNGKASGEPRRLPPVALAILSSPKPTAKRFYIANGDNQQYAKAGQREHWSESNAWNAYDDPTNFLRGRKFFRHHRTVTQQEYRRAGGRADDQNRTVKDALEPGATFEFQIDFENLAPLELGALLWSLELDGKGHHRLGFGKPLGFGSVRLQVRALELLAPSDRYASIKPRAGWSDAMKHKTSWVEQFRRELAATYPQGKEGFDAMPNIADLLTLLCEPAMDLPIHYPRTKKKPDPEGKNFEWFMANKKGPGLVLRWPASDKGLPLLERKTGGPHGHR